MSAPQPHGDTSPPAHDPRVARAERRQAMLERLAEKGMALVDAITADGSPVSAESFAKLSRAVRLTLALSQKLDYAERARLESRIAAAAELEVKAREAADVDPFAPIRTGRKAQVREWLRDVIDHEIPDAEANDILVDALDERLLCDDANDDLDSKPARDIV